MSWVIGDIALLVGVVVVVAVTVVGTADTAVTAVVREVAVVGFWTVLATAGDVVVDFSVVVVRRDQAAAAKAIGESVGIFGVVSVTDRATGACNAGASARVVTIEAVSVRTAWIGTGRETDVR